MSNAELRWNVVQLLIAEAPLDADFVVRSIAAHWDTPERDLEALEVFSKSGQWSPAIVVNYGETLGDDRAADLFKIYLEHVKVSNEDRLQFHGLDKLAQRSTPAFANVLLLWFAHVASRDEPRSRGLLDAYPASSSLPHWWDYEQTEHGIFGITKAVLFACAKEHR